MPQQKHVQKHSHHNAHNNVYRHQAKQLKRAGELLRRGGIVVYPTDTAYAIGCIIHNRSAIQRIMKLKGRRDTKFTVIASSLYQVEQHFSLNTAQRRLARRYWPGPLSIVVNPHMAVRVPQQFIARSLARRAGAPIIATSVNVSGQPPVYSLTELARRFPQLMQQMMQQMIAAPDIMLIDGGVLPRRSPSTVVECVGNQYRIHRQGTLRIADQPNLQSNS